MATATIFEISTELDRLESELENTELSPEEAEQLIRNKFFSGEGLKKKCADWMKRILEKEALAAAQKENSDRLAANAKRNAEEAKFRKDLLCRIMQHHGIERVEEADCPKFSVATAGGKAPIILDEFMEVPRDYQKEIPARWKTDKDKIRQYLENGVVLDFARLGERTKYIRMSGGKKAE